MTRQKKQASHPVIFDCPTHLSGQTIAFFCDTVDILLLERTTIRLFSERNEWTIKQGDLMGQQRVETEPPLATSGRSKW